ncbi:TFIIH/NER complex subunit [Entomophthora muscae]|uniref:TFIIH/NER complex subunit n=1 Tax=Entomophthora muscae TaxID=34485 RepID=A0ACC2SY88_9FUNG|nr:TFIIH/NER complex subunit [Entomophthora muscae]
MTSITSSEKRNGQTPAISDMDDVCPICKGDRYLNPNMVILVGPCFHIMCDKCVDRLFSLDPAPCPTCRQTLRKVDFISQTFEDLEVEKEVRIRKKLARDYNLREDDFQTLKEYDAYLEDLEDITFNLVNGLDIEETTAKIEEHKKVNAKVIKRNIERKAIEDRFYSQKEENERKVKIDKKDSYLQEINEEKKRKREQKEDLIEQLANSSQSAQEIVKKHQKLEQKAAIDSQRLQSRTNVSSQPGSLSFLRLQQLEEDQAEDHEYFNAVVPFFREAPTKSDFKPFYFDSVWRTDKKAEAMASAGGYMLRHAHSKAISSIHDGVLVPLPM